MLELDARLAVRGEEPHLDLGEVPAVLLTVPWIEWLATGHQLTASVVKMRKASSTAQSTVTVLRTTSITSASFMTNLLFGMLLPRLT